MKARSFRLNVALGVVALAVAMVGFAAANYSDNPTAHNATGIIYPVSAPPQVTDDQAKQSIASAKQLSTAFRVISERVLPSVVTIETRAQVTHTENHGRSRQQVNPFGNDNPFKGTPFEDFFRDAPQGFQFEMPRTLPQEGSGSGLIIDASGLIMTNNHVVASIDNAQITIRLQDGREFKADKVWTDPKTDIAIVKINGAVRPRARPTGQ